MTGDAGQREVLGNDHAFVVSGAHCEVHVAGTCKLCLLGGNAVQRA
jgi:hypothetical protein